jgi:hypothetical protein
MRRKESGHILQLTRRRLPLGVLLDAELQDGSHAYLNIISAGAKEGPDSWRDAPSSREQNQCIESIAGFGDLLFKSDPSGVRNLVAIGSVEYFITGKAWLQGALE